MAVKLAAPVISLQAAARHVAPALLAEGLTAAEIREVGAGRPRFRVIANEMDAITAASAVPAQRAPLSSVTVLA